ncbi:MAG: hypothetical protein CM15mP98_04140 [Paracoccaceae bacterium]|nr:MAG: hypothetical protein CM15mP98_04140 [Paracoccaceae bacterium]
MKIVLCALGVLSPLCIMTAVAAEVDLKRITVSEPIPRGVWKKR